MYHLSANLLESRQPWMDIRDIYMYIYVLTSHLELEKSDN